MARQQRGRSETTDRRGETEMRQAAESGARALNEFTRGVRGASNGVDGLNQAMNAGRQAGGLFGGALRSGIAGMSPTRGRRGAVIAAKGFREGAMGGLRGAATGLALGAAETMSSTVAGVALKAAGDMVGGRARSIEDSVVTSLMNLSPSLPVLGTLFEEAVTPMQQAKASVSGMVGQGGLAGMTFSDQNIKDMYGFVHPRFVLSKQNQIQAERALNTVETSGDALSGVLSQSRAGANSLGIMLGVFRFMAGGGGGGIGEAAGRYASGLLK